MSFSPQRMWFKPNDKFQKRLSESIYAVCLSPSGYLILAGGSSGSVKVWDASSGKLEDEIYIGSAVLHITWVGLHSCLDAFFVASEDGSICLYWRQPLSYFASFWMHLPHKAAHRRSFDCALKTTIPGAVEGLDYQHGMLAAVGGGELTICELDARRSRLTSGNYSLRELWSGALVPLLSSLTPTIRMEKKQPNTVHFLAKELVLVSMVDSDPVGQSSVLVILQLEPLVLITAVEISRRVGRLALNPASGTFAITNLRDGIDVFSLPNFSHLGTIKQKFWPNFNVTLGVTFLGGYIVSGGHGQVWMYEADTLGFVSGLHSKEQYSVYRSVAGSISARLILAGADDGSLTVWKFWNPSPISHRWWPTFRAVTFPSRHALCVLIFMVALYVPIIYIGILSLKN